MFGSPLINRPPGDTIAFTERGPVSVGLFLAQAARLADQMPDHRFVINLAVDRYHFLLGFCAGIMRGQCTLMPPNRLQATLDYLEEEYPDSYRLQPGDRLVADAVSQRLGPAADVPLVPLDQLCAIAFTSGSTGKPSPHPKAWKTLVDGTASNERLLEIPGARSLNVVATVPSQHMWGMETSVLLPMLAPVSVCWRSPFFPQDVADALWELPEPRALVSSPVHLEALLKSGVGLPPLERIFSATAPISQAQAERLEVHFSTRFQEVFGCSETGIMATRDTVREAIWRVGHALRIEPREHEFLVVGDHLPAPVVLPDVIEMHGNDRFHWIGRHQDMVKVAGKRESLSDLNLHLLAIDGVRDGVIFMPGPEARRPAALVVSEQLRPREIRKSLGRHVDAVFLPRPIYMVDALPRQETGKLARNALLDLYQRLRHASQGEKS